MINQIYKLNMIPDKVPIMVRVSQYDQYSRTIIFDLYDGAIEYEIPSGSTLTIRGTKPDKTGFEYPCTFSGNRVEFLLEPQVSVISGLVPAELRITSNNEIVGSCNFIFNVEETPLDKDTIISDTELPLIEEASQAAVIAQGAAARAEAEADRAEEVLSSAVKSVNNELPDTQGNVEIVIPDVSNKMDKVSSPTANDILLVDSNGQAVDSGKQLNELANASDVQQLSSDLQTTNTNIGTLSNLNTTNKNNLVSAINEANTAKSKELVRINPTTAYTEYNLNDSIENYNYFILAAMVYDNIMSTTFVTKEWLVAATSSNRIIRVTDTQYNAIYSLYLVNNTRVAINSNTSVDTSFYCVLIGMK